MLKISVGHTPDSDDAFMFYAMLEGKIPSHGFDIEHVVMDIENLNKRAKSPDLDVTAVSVHACAYMPNYTMLRSGGSFGINYGPILTAKSQLPLENIKNIAIPGTMTSAYLLAQLMLGKFNYTEMNFSDIPLAVKKGKVDAGIVIHESQLAYVHEDIVKILDFGEWWSKETGGLPVPLGINVIKSSLGNEIISKFDEYLHESIKFGLDNFEETLDYAMKYSRDRPRDLIAKFVKMYVNKYTVDMGKPGEDCIREFFDRAASKNLIPKCDINISKPKTYIQ